MTRLSFLMRCRFLFERSISVMNEEKGVHFPRGITRMVPLFDEAGQSCDGPTDPDRV